MHHPIFYPVFITGVLCVTQLCGQSVQQLEAFPLKDVQLLESPFLSAQQTDLAYILELDPDRLLAPYLLDAGLPAKAERYGNWENSGLDGHIGGHYLSALSMMYASTGNEKLLERLKYMITVLEQCQEKNGNGYVGGIPGGQAMWEEVSKGNIDAGSFSLNGKWVPLYNIHKLFAGLRDAYLIAGNEQAKNILIRLSDWMLDITDSLTDEQMQTMLRSEHGGMNEVLAEVHAITGEEKYLKLAERFSHRFLLDPLLEKHDQLTGMHANTQIPKVIGFKRIADLSGRPDWSEASAFFWETVVSNRTVAIGGNSVREHFNPIHDFSSMIESNQGPETCNTYNMLRLSQLLFLSDPDSEYMDYYERALYNHILSTQHPEGGFVYFTPMRPQHYRVYSQPHEGFWCCVGSGLENHAKYGEMIYAHEGNDLYVNLFIPSRLHWQEKGLVLTQTTQFPHEESTTLRLELDSPGKFALNIRYPRWVDRGRLEILVNGKAQMLSHQPSSYVQLDRKWKDGDEVKVNMPMQTSVEYLPDSSSWAAILHGPIVMAAVTDSSDLDGLWADDSRMAHVAGGDFYPIDKAPMIVAESDSQILSTIQKKGPLLLTINSFVYPDKDLTLKLVPFYTVHEARYMIYWPVVRKDELKDKISAIRQKEEELLELEARTVDQVATGEQQPESDHQFRGEQTNSGLHRGMFWRDARGWFSYNLKNPGAQGKILRITYFNGDRNRRFSIYFNDQLLETVDLDGTGLAEFYHIDYPISDELLQGMKDDQFTLRFEAEEGSVAGGIYYVRLLKE